MRVRCLTRVQDGTRKQEEGKTAQVILWELLCWETLGPGFHMGITLTLTTNIVADQVYSTATLFNDGRCLSVAPCHTAKTVKEFV